MKTLKLAIFTIFLVLTIFSFSNAQDVKAEKQDWVQIVSADRELAVNLPNDFSVLFDKDTFFVQNPNNDQESYELRNLRSITSYQNGASMWLDSYESENAAKAFPFFVADSRKRGKAENYSVKNSAIKEFILEDGIYAVKIFFHSTNQIYVLGTASHEKNNAAMRRFLETASFLGRTFRKPSDENTMAKKSIPLDSLITTELSNDENSRTNQPLVKAGVVKPNGGATRKITIIDSPRARYSAGARRADLQGAVIARVQFGRNGQVENVEITKSLPFGLDQQALKAARRIRFLPGQRNGIKYTIIKSIQYSFSIY